MIRKFAVVLAAATVLGLAGSASAQVMIDSGYRYGGWWGGPYAYEPYAGTVVVRRHHFFPHHRYYHDRMWWGGY